MSSISYNGDIINSTVLEISKFPDKFSSLSVDMKKATNTIISAKGFQEYIGGLSNNNFCVFPEECGNLIEELKKQIRKKQISILECTQDKNDINQFLNSLDRVDYQNLDLSAIENNISAGRKAENVFKGVGATVATVGLGLVEGVADLVETGADLVHLGGTLIASIFTKGYDLITGKDTTKKMWEQTKAKVSEKKVESLFNRFYDNTEIGRKIKNNAYGFSTVRGISKGLGYTAGMIGLTAITGGLSSGLGVGASGSIGAGQLAATAGTLGFANGTEEAWADGATIEKGLLYGAASGVWEGAQWYAGAKINQYGGLGDKIAKGVFKGAAKGVGIRIAMDTVDSGLEGFVQPALSMIYKDYEGASIVDKYKTAFSQAGGWKNVLSQAAMGAIGSAVGEFTGARKLLKEADAESDKVAKEVFATTAAGGGGAGLASVVSTESIMDNSKALLDQVDLDDATKHFASSTNIDGGAIETANNLFNSKQSKGFKGCRWLPDGSYAPTDTGKIDINSRYRGIFSSVDSNVKVSDALNVLEQSKKTMSASTYTSFSKTIDILGKEGLDVNINGLKLIVSTSDGNIGRIRNALGMSYKDVPDSVLDSVTDKIAKEVFDSATPKSLNRILGDDYISALQKEAKDDWHSFGFLMGKNDADDMIRKIAQKQSPLNAEMIRQHFGAVSDETVERILHSGGYPQTIYSILADDQNVSKSVLEELSNSGAARLFKSENLTRYRASMLVSNGDYDYAFRILGGSTVASDANCTDLLKAVHLFSSEHDSRKAYYWLRDSLTSKYGKEDAIKRIAQFENDALKTLGMDNGQIFTPYRTGAYKWDDSVLEGLEELPSNYKVPDFIKKNYYDPSTKKYKVAKFESDFSNAMEKSKKQGTDYVHRYSMNSDLTNSPKAVDAYREVFMNGLNSDNPEAFRQFVAVASKLVELDSKGRPITIFCDKKAKCYYSKSSISLDENTIKHKIRDPMFHETGHAIFDAQLGSRVPDNFESIRLAAVEKLSDPNIKKTLEAVESNIFEINAHSEYMADSLIYNNIKKMGYNSFSEYENALANKYSNMNMAARMASFDKNPNGLKSLVDYSDPYSCAKLDLISLRKKVTDNVKRQKHGHYVTISGMIDSATKHDVSLWYGHSKEYFNSNSNKAMHELIADYTSLKLNGDTKSIQVLRKILGKDLIDLLDDTYCKMLA